MCQRTFTFLICFFGGQCSVKENTSNMFDKAYQLPLPHSFSYELVLIEKYKVLILKVFH